MKKTLLAIALVFIGLLIWAGLLYLGFAFVQAEVSPFAWPSETRAGMMRGISTPCFCIAYVISRFLFVFGINFKL